MILELIAVGTIAVGTIAVGTIAVGTALRPSGSGRPPHRSERAELPHSAPASGSIVEASRGIGVDNTRSREPSHRKPVHAGPGHPASLASTPQGVEPRSDNLGAKAGQPRRRSRSRRDCCATTQQRTNTPCARPADGTGRPACGLRATDGRGERIGRIWAPASRGRPLRASG